MPGLATEDGAERKGDSRGLRRRICRGSRGLERRRLGLFRGEERARLGERCRLLLLLGRLHLKVDERVKKIGRLGVLD